MGKLLFMPMLTVGHFSVGCTLINYLKANFKDAHEYVILSDQRFESKLKKMSPGARIRLYNNPNLPENFDPNKHEDPNDQLMDEISKTFHHSTEERMKYRPSIMIRLCDDLKAIQQEIETIIEDEKPDFIFFDHLFVLPFLINKKVPWGFICSANPLFVQYDEEGLPPFCSGYSSDISSKPKWDEFREIFRKYNKPVQEYFNNWMAECNCDPFPEGKFVIGSPYVNIYLYPKELDYYEPNDSRLRGNWVSVDSCILPEEVRKAAGEEIPKLDLDLTSFPNKEPNRCLVYFSLGTLISTQPTIMSRIIDMLGTIEHNFIVSKGARGDQLKLPENCIGANFLPQTTLLNHIKLIITHGGNNTLTESVYYGCPMIILPVFGDQPDNAVRMKELGLGKHLNLFTCTRDELAEAIDHLLFDPTVRQKMKQIRDRIQQDNRWEKVSRKLLPYLNKTLN